MQSRIKAAAVRSLYWGTFLLLVFLTALGVTSTAQQNPQRLILKDGSYQTVTKWEVNGNRVRYYSAERFIWEELPNDLVDWPATNKYNQERTSQRVTSVQQMTTDAQAEDATPTVAPGLSLPDGGGVFLLDTFQGQPQLLELAQSGGELNRHTGKNILRAAINPVALSSKQTIELPGERAKIQAHVSQPVIYIDIDSGSSPGQAQAQPQPAAKTEQQQQQYGIVRAEKRKGVRVVGSLSVAVYGKVSHKENWIKTTVTPIGEWVKVTPSEPLPPGEYAIVEMLEKGQVNLYVWDFGVDPAAPANPNAWTARHSATGSDNKQPVLEKRPK
jgi:hypothetical protein